MVQPIRATWYFDFISPFAYLHFCQFDRLAADLDIEYVPVLFAGLLKAHGHKGPAEIVAKRRQTYRMCVWLAQENGIEMRFPPTHPFNPLHVLRLAVAAGSTRFAASEIFDCIWKHGAEISDSATFDALAARLGIDDAKAAIAEPNVKQALIANTERAIARGVYGVPTFDFRDELFWGVDSIGLMNAYVADPTLFTRGEYARVDALPTGAMRKEA